MMKNRFNNIDSKEWLPYQESWNQNIALIKVQYG
jgi:hypothetical protein